jgi:3-phenylpropionate/trans-cinnamate dioxygenase ferredoxin subunit
MEEYGTSRQEGRRHVVGRTSDLTEGERMIVEVEGREVGIFNIDGEFFAVRNRCPHLGGPLCRGEVLGLVHSSGPGDVQFDASKRLLTCPWHGWEFDIETGQSYFNPRLKAKSYEVGTSQGEDTEEDHEQAVGERAPGPYKADVIPVSREDDYIVITMRSKARETKAEAPR